MKQKKSLKYIATQVYPEIDPTLRRLPHGQGKYGSLKRLFPQHWTSFRNMHDRCQRNGVEVDHHFRRNFQGFWNFIQYMEDPPPDMVVPTVGRIDHSRGYVRENMEWQERSANSREATDRCYMPQRNVRLRILVETCPDLALLGVTKLKSTTLSAWWKQGDEPCRSNNIPVILATLAYTFKGRFAWEIDQPGRGRRATVFTIRVAPSLRKELEVVKDNPQ